MPFTPESLRWNRLAGYLVRQAALEDRIKLIKQKYSKHNLGEWLIKKVSQVDPLHGPYMEWIIRYIIKGDIDIGDYDFDRFNYYLRIFDYIKKSPKLLKQYEISPDINKLTPKNLESLVERYMTEGSPRTEREQQRDTKASGSRTIYDNPPYKIIEIGGPGTDLSMAQGAACLYARNTRWCTSDPYVAESYLEKAPLYIIFENNKKVAQYDPYYGDLNDILNHRLRLSTENQGTILALLNSGVKIPPALAERLEAAGYSLPAHVRQVLDRERDFHSSLFNNL